MFFVLSGYLITGILLSEYESTGNIRLAAFYARRLKRLLPALAVMLCAAILLAFNCFRRQGFAALQIGECDALRDDGHVLLCW